MTRNKVLFFAFLVTVLFGIYRFGLRPVNDLDRMAKELEGLVETTSIFRNMEWIAAKPHRSGTEENQAVADGIISELQSVGARVWTKQYSVSLPQPGRASLTLTVPSSQEIDFYEKTLDDDSYTTIAKQEQPYFAYIPDSDVEADVIYANFGDRQDYELLKKEGISVAGKIAILRTQGSCRGMKQMIAEEEGLAGILLYPEPKDQGFRKPPYPEGPSINPWVAQRGSMLKFFHYPGDPYWKFEEQRESTLPTVPALPITPTAAKTILNLLEGPAVAEWSGWMNVPYRSGPGPARAQLRSTSEHKQMQVRNVFATLGGKNPKDPALVVSTHYDAWVYGASDPGSGTAVVLEVAKALFHLEKNGWKPERDIVFIFWDAEEYGMIGSSRWIAEHVQDVRKRIGNVLYIDSVRGPMFRPTLVPGMRGILQDVLRRFNDPNTGKSVADFHVQYEMPGFSDDTIPFSNMAGIPVAQLNYGIHYTMYHSLYDNLAWMKNFGDPGYKYINILARIVALYSIALTSEERLPFSFSEFATHYENQLSRMRLEDAEGDLSSFDTAIGKARELGALSKQVETHDFSKLSAEERHQINTLLQRAVVSFTEPLGSSSKPFRFRNVLLGPSLDNECGGTELPSIRRAIADRKMEQLRFELSRLSNHFETAADLLRQAITLADSSDGKS